jgi:23S rRNA (cytidine1920-2'-O)/16S rRNA (cytidine1409-2'-O)-methyltransferase
MTKQRLDQELVRRGLTTTRSQAESYVKLGSVFINGAQATKSGTKVDDSDKLELKVDKQYVSRAALKLSSVAKILDVDFRDTVVLDVGSSTGGFTDYALKHGAKKVFAVELGTNQLHQSLRGNPLIELYEKTDIRDFPKQVAPIDIVVIDVSFVSLQDILPSVAKLSNKKTKVLAMVKPQFEAEKSGLKHKGVIKNDRMRRDILKTFESWVQKQFVIVNKADSEVAGAKGNRERFYLLNLL